MRSQPIIMLALAVVFGGASIVAGQRWISRQGEAARQAAEAPAPAPVALSTIVVAAGGLRYGAELTSRNLREMPWPQDALPAGASRTVAELLAGNQKRVVLEPLEPNEPVLASKITGPGQRGTLSALIEEGMGAVTINVNEVVGVAGFVLPGDRVDVLLTRRSVSSDGDAGPPAAYTDVVMRDVKVLAAGQLADQRADRPAIVNAVTLEVPPEGAQKIALATSAGSLSLMLRKAGDTAARPARRITAAEIGRDALPSADRTVMVRVTRGTRRDEYSVPVADRDLPGDRFPRLATAQ